MTTNVGRLVDVWSGLRFRALPLLALAPLLSVAGGAVYFAATRVAAQEELRKEEKKLPIAGVCRDESNGALADVQLELYVVETPLAPEKLVEKTRSDADGSFRFEKRISAGRPGMTENLHTLVARAPGRESQAKRLWPPYGQPDLVDFKLGPAATLKGSVRDAAGKPVVGAQCSFFPGPVGGIVTGVTDKDGNFQIKDVAAFEFAKPGGRMLRVRHPDFANKLFACSKVPDTIKVTLDPAAVVEGRVVDGATGKPVAGVLVGAQGLDQRGYSETFTDADGNYRLKSLAADRYNIFVEHAERTAAALESFATVAGEKFRAPDLRLVEGGIISVRLIDDATGGPPMFGENEHVDMAWYGPDRPQSGAACGAASPLPNGTIRLRIPPGTAYPYFRGTEWNVVSEEPRLRPGVVIEEGSTLDAVIRIRRKN